MEEIKLIYVHKGGPYGDCMSAYDVTFNRPCTLGEFVEAILKRKDEWGEIFIGKVRDRVQLPVLEYKYGKIIRSEFTERDLKKKIKSVYSSYGWTSGSYWVETE